MFVNFNLKDFLKDALIWIKDSNNFLKKLRKHGKVGDGFCVTTAEVVVMSLKIDTDKRISFLIAALDTHAFITKLD